MSRNTLVLGASSAIGLEIIRTIDRDDRQIVAHYHSSRKPLEELSEKLTSKLLLVAADLSTLEGCEALFEQADLVSEVPDEIVFLPAPKLSLVRFKQAKWSDFQLHLDLQVGAAVRVLAYYLPKMSDRQSGKVVFVSSSTTLGVPMTGWAHYTTAKYAQIGLMKSLAAEYAGRKININAVSPSMVDTPYLSGLPHKLIEFSAQKNPMSRNATPADIAPAVAFLLSDSAGYITGANLPISGGSIF